MPNETYPRDRFDDIPRQRDRIGAHRAENPRMRVGVALLWAGVAAVVLFCAGVVTFLALSQQQDVVAEPEPEPSVAAVVDTSYEVLILNGTSSQGAEVRAEEQLVAAGWNGDDVSAGASSATDIPETVVYYAAPEHEAAAAGVAEALGGGRLQESTAYVSDPATKIVTVVLGLDRVSAG
ncbi:LytR C-terminal domain-containing protein [Microbacterium sp. Marseille-Q6965]|uniref:LytR C-terminal domain-containing protein n=1 Tax=Microbacterium sp. Marseille-Q6965 TaxID=2965072 RepID=UPI0021B758D5|nr:LytR C-terminal domain-containing protein [Microbacterium sp. Marseille-Q6965]